ncbi:uncharacterized protein LOC134686124 [Mytilus trossulus]|uniref:uncharacterized protein LOC134686124 n=1 Tax=Mytilus trossulus TaxID=6551 RepID=UPI0030058BE9
MKSLFCAVIFGTILLVMSNWTSLHNSSEQLQEHCPATDIYEIALSTVGGEIFSMLNANHSIMVRFDDSNFYSINIYKECYDFQFEIEVYFGYYIDVLELQDLLALCENGTVIEKLFCDPFSIYNVNYVDDSVFPYFSGVNIFFSDELHHCTALFRNFITQKNYTVTNVDLNFFLYNMTSCWGMMSLLNQQNIFILQPNEYDMQGMLVLGEMAVGFSQPDYKAVFIGTQDGSCMKRFVEYFRLNSYYTSEEYILSPDVIIEFKNENSCLEVYYNCRKDWDFILPVDLPNKSLAYLQMVIAGEVTLVNCFVLYIFLQKSNRSPTTLLLSMLAVSDTLTALFICIPTIIAYQVYQHHISFNGTVLSWNLIDYNSCIISGATHFKYAFHLLSVLITTLLSMQKAIALRFPLWSIRGLTNNRSVKSSAIAFTLSIILFLPNVVIWKILSKDVDGSCCIDGDLIVKYYDVYRNINLTSDILTVIAIFISLICTIYITCKLTCLRRNLPWSDNMTVRKKHLMSAITVVVICGIFIASEVLHIMTGVMFWIVTYYESDYKLVTLLESTKQYSDLSLLIGFSLNFVVYLAMSTQLREKLLNGAKEITGSKRRKKNDRKSVSNSTTRKYINSNSNES